MDHSSKNHPLKCNKMDKRTLSRLQQSSIVHKERLEKARAVRKLGPSKLDKLPLPVLQIILVYSIDTLQELVNYSLICRKFNKTIQSSQYLWYCLSSRHFPKSMSAIVPLEQIHIEISQGIFNTVKNWREFYLERWVYKKQLQRKKFLETLQKSINVKYSPKLASAIQQLGFEFSWRSSRLPMSIPSSDKYYFASSMTIRIVPTVVTRDPGVLELLYNNVKYQIRPEGNPEVLHQSDVSLCKYKNLLYVRFTGEIGFLCWTINYLDIITLIVKYKIHARFDDISSTFGLHSYSLVFELRTGGKSLFCEYRKPFDLDLEKKKAVGYIEKIKFSIPKDKLFVGWKTEAFTGKFNSSAVVDCTLRSEFGDPLWWISQAGKVVVFDRDSFGGDMYILKIDSAPGSVACFFRDKVTEWELDGIQVSLSVDFIRSIFAQGRNS